MAKWKNGIYKIQNPDKYMLQKKEAHYKSNLEERTCYFLDMNSNVVRWQYEGYAINYQKPMFVGGKLHPTKPFETRRYIIDFYAEIKDKDGTIKKYILEVKSASATRPPIRPKRMTSKAQQRFIQECATFAINRSKWDAAKKFCDEHGIIFKMLLDDAIL